MNNGVDVALAAYAMLPQVLPQQLGTPPQPRILRQVHSSSSCIASFAISTSIPAQCEILFPSFLTFVEMKMGAELCRVFASDRQNASPPPVGVLLLTLGRYLRHFHCLSCIIQHPTGFLVFTAPLALRLWREQGQFVVNPAAIDWGAGAFLSGVFCLRVCTQITLWSEPINQLSNNHSYLYRPDSAGGVPLSFFTLLASSASH